MITFPNAKINLGLNIIEKRPDGYHNLETIFYPIPLCDTLQLEAAGNTSRERYCHRRNALRLPRGQSLRIAEKGS